MRKKDSLPVLRQMGNLCYTRLNHRLSDQGLSAQDGAGGSKVAWRAEQADAVMDSGPLVAGRRPMLAKRAMRKLPSF